MKILNCNNASLTMTVTRLLVEADGICLMHPAQREAIEYLLLEISTGEDFPEEKQRIRDFFIPKNIIVDERMGKAEIVVKRGEEIVLQVTHIAIPTKFY